MGNKDSRECGGGGGFVGGGCIFLLGLQGFGVRGPTSLWEKKGKSWKVLSWLGLDSHPSSDLLTLRGE